MPAKQIKNVYVNPQNKLNYSRSLFNWEDCHSFNMLTGYIYPVATLNCMPGDTVPNKFGFVLQSAPLISPTLDNVYIDIISVWVPTRLVMADFNEWLGDSDTYAWTLTNNVKYPKVDSLDTGIQSSWNGQSGTFYRSKAYYAEHYLAPHLGCRLWDTQAITFATAYGTGTRLHDGVSIIPSRAYQLMWNRLFRNENIQNPILFSKSSTFGSLDYQYRDGLGKLQKANRLKDMFNMARLAPSIQTVDLGLGADLPVITGTDHGTITSNPLHWRATVGGQITGNTAFGAFDGDTYAVASSNPGSTTPIEPTNLWTDLSSLTVNSMYYAIMLQKYYNKASNGRRPVEFYANMFGVMKSNAAYDDPELLSQKRYKVNISRVVATGNSENAEGEMQGLGTQGAFSVTSVGGTLFPEFTATEYGTLMVVAVIRGQESYSSGCDRYLTDGGLLDTYLPVFDHIGEDYVEFGEIGNTAYNDASKVFGYNNAWYNYRMHTNHVLGILSPGEPLDYWTLARDFDATYSTFTVNSAFIEQSMHEFDRMLQLKVAFKDSFETWSESIPDPEDPAGELEVTRYADEDGEPLLSDRYQWLIQFCLAGQFARTMSKDSEPLLFGARI